MIYMVKLSIHTVSFSFLQLQGIVDDVTYSIQNAVPNSEVIYRKIFLVEGSDKDSVLWFADEQATLRLVKEFVLK